MIFLTLRSASALTLLIVASGRSSGFGKSYSAPLGGVIGKDLLAQVFSLGSLLESLLCEYEENDENEEG